MLTAIVDGRQCGRDLEAASARLYSTCFRQWSDTSKDAEHYMKGSGVRGLFKNRTYKLRSSMSHVALQFGPLSFRTTVKASAPYAAFVDEGTRPHAIVAVNAPYLVFFWEKIGRWVRTKSVRHPGSRAAWFSLDLADTFESRFANNQQSAVNSVTGGL